MRIYQAGCRFVFCVKSGFPYKSHLLSKSYHLYTVFFSFFLSLFLWDALHCWSDATHRENVVWKKTAAVFQGKAAVLLPLWFKCKPEIKRTWLSEICGQASLKETEANQSTVCDYNQPPPSLLTLSFVKWWLTQPMHYYWLCLFIFKGNKIKPQTSQERGANSTWYEPNVAPKAPLKEHTCRHRHLSTKTNTHAHQTPEQVHHLTC